MSNPIENIHSYVMVHGGIDRQERLIDVEWLRDLKQAADDIINAFTDEEVDVAIDKLRKVVRSNGRGRTEA